MVRKNMKKQYLSYINLVVHSISVLDLKTRCVGLVDMIEKHFDIAQPIFNFISIIILASLVFWIVYGLYHWDKQRRIRIVSEFGSLDDTIYYLLEDLNSQNIHRIDTKFLIRLKELENTLTKLGITTPQKFQNIPEVKDLQWKNWIEFLTIMQIKSGDRDFKGAKNWMKEYSTK